MDPLSITTSCLSLISGVSKTTIAITDFVRGCRDARSDLSAVAVELSQLQLVLELLKDDTSVTDDRVLPESLQIQIISIIKNCSKVISTINTFLAKHDGKAGAAMWATFGKTEVSGLRMSLEAHRGSLNLVLELVSVYLSKAIKQDTSVIRDDLHEIKQDTSQIPQIMEELTRLRAIVAAGVIPPVAGESFLLQNYLDSLTSYAETVCNDVEWDSDRSSLAVSQPPSPTVDFRPRSVISDNSNSQARVTSPEGIEIENLPLNDRNPKHANVSTVTTPDEGQASSSASSFVDTDTPPPPTDEQSESNIAAEDVIRRKLVIVGDSSCGKTPLLIMFAKGCFIESSYATVFENYVGNTEVDGKNIELALWDTAGVEEFDRLRPLSYPDSHVILLCFAIDDPRSLDSIQEKWMSEVLHFCPEKPLLLVGLRKDLRTDPKRLERLKDIGERPVSWEEGFKISKKIGVANYLECSAKTGEGVKEVFDMAARWAMYPNSGKEKKSKGFRKLFRMSLR